MVTLYEVFKKDELDLLMTAINRYPKQAKEIELSHPFRKTTFETFDFISDHVFFSSPSFVLQKLQQRYIDLVDQKEQLIVRPNKNEFKFVINTKQNLN